jgi:hypothetical protein
VVPGTRVSVALIHIVEDARAAGRLRAVETTKLHRQVTHDMKAIAGYAATELSPEHLFAALLAWTQLFGLVGFELFGQTRGLVTDDAAFLRDAATSMGTHIGL